MVTQLAHHLGRYLKATNRFIVSYFNDHEFVYVTESAQTVVCEISRRVAACQNLVRARHGINFTPRALENAAKVICTNLL